MDLICRVLKERGARCVAIEDPAFESLGTNINVHGLVTHRLAVDDGGMQVDRLRATAADAVVVTPAHQYPTGAVLSPQRRDRLLAWARERNALIIEDDYDAEFRYDGPASGALQGQAAEHTLYVGTASKTLTPALRLGWILAPASMAAALAALKRRVDRGASAIEQIALAEFIEHGDLDRHLRHMRLVYRQRRDAVLAALARHRFEHRAHGIRAGLHLMIELPRDVDEFELVRQAQLQSVRLFAGRGFWSQPQAAPPALVLGYGAIELEDIDEGIARLARIVRDGVRPAARLQA
jgi:GntR family transcriptional regulator / MocR family aminotransferase